MITLSVLECVELLAVAFAPLLIVVLWGCARLPATIPPLAAVPSPVELPEFELLSEGLNVIDPRRLQRLDG